MTFNLKNSKPLTGDVAGVYFVKNPDNSSDNGIYVININGQNPIRMASAVNMTDYLTVANAILNYAPKANPTNGQNNYAPKTNPTFTGDVILGTGNLAADGSLAAAGAIKMYIPAGVSNAYGLTAILDTTGTLTEGTAKLKIGNTSIPNVELAGNFVPQTNNSKTLGSASLKWSNIYAVTSAIDSSDARLKTAVLSFTQDELNAAKQLSKEIGIYKWLTAVSEKGDLARKHIGMTVQRAIEIMTANNLNPFTYGFICYDEWQDEFETIPATEEVAEHQVQTKVAGNIYSFRYTELLAFIARGFEERLTALENV